MDAAGDHVFVIGSYSSAEARAVEPSNPPATRTSPFPRRVAVWKYRAWAIDAAGDHVLVAGSYSSADASAAELSNPPATRTSPFGRSVAVWRLLAWAMLPAEDHGLGAAAAAGAAMDRTNEPTIAAATLAARNLRAILI